MKKIWNRRLIAAVLAALLLTASGCAAGDTAEESAPTEEAISAPETTAAQTEEPEATEAAEPEATEAAEEAEEEQAALTVVETARQTYGDSSFITYPVLEGEGAELLNSEVLADLESTMESWEMNVENGDVFELSLEGSTLTDTVATFLFSGMVDGADASHPSNVFFIANYDIATGERLGASDLIDPADVCAAVTDGRWTDCGLTMDFESQKADLLESFELLGTETIAEWFTREGFNEYGWSSDTGAGYYTAEDGTVSIIVCFPVSHAMGDYVVGKIEE